MAVHREQRLGRALVPRLDEELEAAATMLLGEVAAAGTQVFLQRGKVVVREWEERPLGDELRERVARLEGCMRSVLERDQGEAELGGSTPDATESSLFPLTELQRAYYVGERYFRALKTPAYVTTCYRLAPEQAVERIRAAFLGVMARHPMLRARVFDLEHQEIVALDEGWDFDRIDATALDSEAWAARLELELRDIGSRLPSLDRGPQLAIVLLEGGRERYLLVCVRLFVLDAQSIGLFYRELERQLRMDARAEGEAGPQFSDFSWSVTHQRGHQAYRNSLAHWVRRIPALPGPPDVPLVRGGLELESASFARRRFRVDAVRWQRLQDRARSRGVTVNALMLTCYTDVLRRWSSTKAFCVTVLVSLRAMSESPDALASIIGNFGTTSLVASNGEEAEEASFVARTRTIQDQLISILQHGRVSALEILRLARAQRAGIADNIPFVFASGLGFHGSDVGPHYARVEGWTLVHQSMQTPQVLLDHQIFEDEGELVCSFDYVDAAFPPGLIEDMLTYYEALVDDLCQDERAWERSGRRPLPARLLAARRAANQTTREIGARSLCAALRERCRAQPEACAMVGDGESIRYGELHARIAGVIARLQEQGVRPGDVVAILGRKGIDPYVAAAAIVWMGAAYLPLNPAWPSSRIARFIEHCEARAVLVDELGHERLRPLAGEVALVPIRGRAEPPSVDIDALQLPDPGGLAYIIFTSGSTGVPKATAISHRSAWNTIQDVIDRFEITAHDRVLALSALSFDLSVFDLFGTLGAGATLVVPPASDQPDPERWRQLVREHRTTVWNSVPALMELLLDARGASAADELASLRLVMLSGDWVPVGLPAKLHAVVPDVRVVALGGATEASIWSNFHEVGEVPPSWESIPYGRPLANQRFHILDEALEPAPNWVAGELYIAGAGVGMGYHRQPELTALAFSALPPFEDRAYRTGDYGRYWLDGTIEFLGRRDAQVKVRGFRLDLREIEQALLSQPAIEQAVCLAHGSGANRSLVAFVVRREGDVPLEPRALVAALAEHLPPYAVPDRFVPIERVPLTANGKRDLHRLVELLSLAPEPAAATGELTRDERRIQALWSSECGVEVASADADFFHVGGNSLTAVRLVHAINQQLGLELPVSTIFESRTLRAQADLVQAKLPARSTRCLVSLRKGDPSRPHLVLVHPVGGTLYGYGSLLRALPADWNVHGIQCPPPAHIPSSLVELVARYVDELRGVEHPLHLVGWSMGGILSLELERQLRAGPCPVRSLTLIDSYGRTASSPDVLTEGAAAQAFLRDYLAGQRLSLDVAPPEPQEPFLRYVRRLQHLGTLPADLPLAELEQIFGQFRALFELLLQYSIPVQLPGLTLLFFATRRAMANPSVLAPLESLVDISAHEHHSLDFDHHAIMGSSAAPELAARILHHVSSHD